MAATRDGKGQKEGRVKERAMETGKDKGYEYEGVV